MTRIAVFDSGLGSLSIILPIQKNLKCSMVYLADQHNFPYGNKSKKQLDSIIKNSISFLEKNYAPEIIVVGSNTPSLLLDTLPTKIIKVTPPLSEASRISKTNHIALLATESVIQNKVFENFIKNCNVRKKTIIHKINASQLVNLVESGYFIKKKKYCKKIIQKHIARYFFENKIDVAILGSTHLPFLKPLLQSEFSNITFLEPSNAIVQKILKQKIVKQKRNSMKIITTGNPKKLKKILTNIGIKNSVTQIPPL